MPTWSGLTVAKSATWRVSVLNSRTLPALVVTAPHDTRPACRRPPEHAGRACKTHGGEAGTHRAPGPLRRSCDTCRTRAAAGIGYRGLAGHVATCGGRVRRLRRPAEERAGLLSEPDPEQAASDGRRQCPRRGPACHRSISLTGLRSSVHARQTEPEHAELPNRRGLGLANLGRPADQNGGYFAGRGVDH